MSNVSSAQPIVLYGVESKAAAGFLALMSIVATVVVSMITVSTYRVSRRSDVFIMFFSHVSSITQFANSFKSLSRPHKALARP